jgi:lactoylglutathione lyase
MEQGRSGVMTMLAFRYSVLLVADVPATVEFYQRAFGLALRYLHPSRGYAELDTGATLLAFISDAFAAETHLLGDCGYTKNSPTQAAAGTILAFVSADVHVDYERAVAAGAVVVKRPEPKPWGQTTGYVRDPNGVLVEVSSRSPRDAPA